MATNPTRQALNALLGRKVTFNADGLISFHGADFLKDPRFIQAYDVGTSRMDDAIHIEWRVRVALWAASNGMKLEGDFVECGVDNGVLSGAIAQYVAWPGGTEKKLYLLDTFSGIPTEGLGADSMTAASHRNRGYTGVYERVRDHFSQYRNVILVRGAIPQTLSEVPSEKVAYLSVDMNVPEPEMAAAEYFWPKLVPGAVILLDDFNYRGFETQRRAWTQFAQRRGVDILPLPTGQGVIIRPPLG
jgi:O-methyltransferase